MKRVQIAYAAMLVLLIAAAPSAVAIGWEELLSQRLDESVAYRQAVLQRRQAELRMDQLDRFYLPYISVGTAGQTSITYVGGEGGGLQPFVVQPSVSFSNVLGANLALGLPVTVLPSPPEGVDAVTVGDPSLVVTRRLFEETDATALSARSALIRARDAEAGALAEVRLGLVSEVFDARATLQTVADSRTRLENARRLADASRDESTARELERAILQAERARIQAERTLRTLDDVVIEHADHLYAEILERFEVWVADLARDGTMPETSAAVRAQQLALAAAEARASRAFLPYLPNPSFEARVSYDRDENDLNWSVGLRFSLPIIDRGERSLAAFERRESAEIERLRLETTAQALDLTARSAWDDLELVELEARIAALDLEVQEESAARVRALHDEGFATRESLVNAELALSAARLQLERAQNGYRLQQLRLLRLLQ